MIRILVEHVLFCVLSWLTGRLREMARKIWLRSIFRDFCHFELMFVMIWQSLESPIALLAALPPTLVHAFYLFISSARALVLLCAWDRDE